MFWKANVFVVFYRYVIVSLLLEIQTCLDDLRMIWKPEIVVGAEVQNCIWSASYANSYTLLQFMDDSDNDFDDVDFDLGSAQHPFSLPGPSLENKNQGI